MTKRKKYDIIKEKSKEIKKGVKTDMLNGEVFRMYKTRGSEELLPIYNKLQRELDLILSNDKYREELMEIDLKYINKKGEPRNKTPWMLREDVIGVIGKRLQGKMPDSWYVRILYHNIISLLKSRKQQVEIYEILKANAYKIDSELRKKLEEKKLFPSNPYLETLAAAKEVPGLPKKKTFILDFAASDKQMFRVGKNGTSWEVKICSEKEKERNNLKTQWIEIETFLPIYIREGFKGDAAKPQFYIDKTRGKFVCAIPCKIEKIPNSYKNIMGVDIGRKKGYSGTVLRADKSISEEYIPTKEIETLFNKLDRLNKHINNVYKKYKASNKYGNKTERQGLRKLDYSEGRKKRTRLQHQIARLIAVEVVNIAIKEECKEIHIENLKWVKNKARKWNFSAIQQCIEEVAELYSIKVVRVSAKNSSTEHPITGEIGKESGRYIVFSSGERIDRDQLAGLNLAVRQPKDKKRKIKQLTKRKEVKIKRKSRQSDFKKLRKEVIDKKIRKKENIPPVMFSHDKVEKIFTIVSVIFCIPNVNSFKDNNIQFKTVFDNFIQ